MSISCSVILLLVNSYIVTCNEYVLLNRHFIKTPLSLFTHSIILVSIYWASPSLRHSGEWEDKSECFFFKKPAIKCSHIKILAKVIELQWKKKSLFWVESNLHILRIFKLDLKE